MKKDYDEKLIKSVFDEIELPDLDLTEKVKEGIRGKKTRKKVSPLRAAVVGVAALMIVYVFAYNAPSMVAYAKELVGSWFQVIHTDEDQVKMEGEFHSLKPTARKTENRYRTMDEIENMLGVNILQSPQAYEGKERLIWYSPYPAEDGSGNLYGAMLMSDLYILGDLQDTVITDYDDIWTVPDIQFKPGKDYKSAVTCQITIRSDIKPDKNYQNHELEYEGSNWDYPEGTESTTYTSKNLNTEVILVHVPMDSGSNDSIDSSGNEERPSLTAHFIYDGIEYVYFGRVAEKTMKGIIEGLHYK